MYSEHGFFIDGAWPAKASGSGSPVTDPATGEWLGIASADSAEDAREAIADDNNVGLGPLVLP